jgi:hypothetical protein
MICPTANFNDDGDDLETSAYDEKRPNNNFHRVVSS